MLVPYQLRRNTVNKPYRLNKDISQLFLSNLNLTNKMADTTQQPIIAKGFTGVAYPDVFNVNAMPAQPLELKPGQLPQHLIQQFFEDGYVIVENFFTREELDTCRKAVNEQVEKLAQKLYQAGKIKNLYSEFGFSDRLTKLEEDFPGANIILHKGDGLPEVCLYLLSL
ncbi:uncharacterized protein [Argopecten irradians]|uniref:uncharacterized protein n=1 Tax=Argopecten irradians TaxID=31199 RepID=UPI0037222F90